MNSGNPTSLPSPLPIVREQLIVVTLQDGLADGTMVHLPADSKRVPCKAERRAFVDVVMPEAPYKWVGRCGVEGVVYVLGGPFARSRVCEDCKTAETRPAPAPVIVPPKPKVAPPPKEPVVMEPVRTTRMGRPTTWTQDRILVAIRRWADEHDGDPPMSHEWEIRGDYWPAFKTVFERFGSWNAAIRAAGFRPRTRGRWGHLEEAA